MAQSTKEHYLVLTTITNAKEADVVALKHGLEFYLFKQYCAKAGIPFIELTPEQAIPFLDKQDGIGSNVFLSYDGMDRPACIEKCLMKHLVVAERTGFFPIGRTPVELTYAMVDCND
jgi:hypothetical protein